MQSESVELRILLSWSDELTKCPPDTKDVAEGGGLNTFLGLALILCLADTSASMASINELSFQLSLETLRLIRSCKSDGAC